MLCTICNEREATIHIYRRVPIADAVGRPTRERARSPSVPNALTLRQPFETAKAKAHPKLHA